MSDQTTFPFTNKSEGIGGSGSPGEVESGAGIPRQRAWYTVTRTLKSRRLDSADCRLKSHHDSAVLWTPSRDCDRPPTLPDPYSCPPIGPPLRQITPGGVLIGDLPPN